MWNHAIPKPGAPGPSSSASASGPSPSKPANPFARPAAQPQAFSRGSLLPARSVAAVPKRLAPITEVPGAAPGSGIGASENAVPSSRPDGITPKASQVAAGTPGVRARPAWRLLWRGGLEIGPDGWRLDDVTFVAHLASPPAGTPTGKAAAAAATGAAPLVPTAFGGDGGMSAGPDADLCLSLESMRGRKYLPVRGVVPITDDDIEADDGAVVQMSITAPLLAALFTGLLCRNSKLSPQGKTTTGVVIGLGDEDVDPTSSSAMIVYGQRQGDAEQPTLRLHVGRRRRVVSAPAEKKVRPGEPLPRALLFPSKAPLKPPPPIRRSMSRALSVSSIYAPPPCVTSRSTAGETQPPASVSGRTPGRRGEKRPRRDGELEEESDSKRRRAGKVVPEKLDTRLAAAQGEDIFGPRSATPSVRPRGSSNAADDGGESSKAATGSAKHAPVPQRILDNKATVRKQTLLLLEARGCGRSFAAFKDVFGMTTKGVYFALRDRMDARLDKSVVQDLVGRHLDMYFPAPEAADGGGPATGGPEDAEVSTRSDMIDLRTPEPASRVAAGAGHRSPSPAAEGTSQTLPPER